MKAAAFVGLHVLLLAGIGAAAAFFWAWWSVLQLAALPDDLHHFMGFLGAVGAVAVCYLTLRFAWAGLNRAGRALSRRS